MKPILGACIACVLLASPAHSELTQQDLDKIRLLVKEEVSKSIADSQAQMKQYIDLKIQNVETQIKTVEAQIQAVETKVEKGLQNVETQIQAVETKVETQIQGVNERVTLAVYLIFALIALIVAAVAIPQFILTWRSRRDAALEKRIEEVVRQNLKMAEDIEILKQQRIARS